MRRTHCKDVKRNTPLLSLPLHHTAKSYLTPSLPAVIAWHLLPVLHHYLTALNNLCTGSMTECRATVIRAGSYGQRTRRPLMLMFSPPGQIFLAHLVWERTSINMATWRVAREHLAQSGCNKSRARKKKGSSSFIFSCFLCYVKCCPGELVWLPVDARAPWTKLTNVSFTVDDAQ